MTFIRESATRWRTACMSAGALVLGMGCTRAPPAAVATVPGPPEVRIITVAEQPTTNMVEVPGRLQSVRSAEVRARVDGIVQRRLYTEGTDVAEGQPLFEIDPRPLQAQLSIARAALQRAQATAHDAAQELARHRDLFAKEAISQQAYDTATARLRTAQADAAQARAQVQAARLNLSYSRVVAPISGRAGRAQVTEGALVSGASATLLTTVEQMDPIDVNFSQSSSEILAIRREIAAGTLQVPKLDHVEVRLVLEDGSEYAHSGRLNFFGMRFDEQTGTTALRAEFENPRRELFPGQFVRVRVAAGVRPASLRVPQRAAR